MNILQQTIEYEVLSYNYGEVVRRLRKSRGLSQMDLEVRAGLNYGVVCRIEKGRINPTKETLLKIAIVLQPNSSEILTLFALNTLKFD